MTEYSYNRAAQMAEARKKRRKKRRRQVWTRRIIFALACLIVIGAVIFGLVKLGKKLFGDNNETQISTEETGSSAAPTEAEPQESTESSSGEEPGAEPEQPSGSAEDPQPSEEPTEPSKPEDPTAPSRSREPEDPIEPVQPGEKSIAAAKRLAAMYDYDGALSMLKELQGSASASEITALTSQFEAAKAACVRVDPETTPHVFFHSLIVDMEQCFGRHDAASVSGFNAWMISCEEFRKVIQMLYDNNYVIFRVSDLYVTEGDEVKPNPNLYLPADRKAIVFSYDDLAYYAQYQGLGFADKLVLDSNGKLKNEYHDASGAEHIGDYDWLPILDAFIDEHPDFSYHGHKGTIALTGYDGVFGYRTDIDFFLEPSYGERVWLESHPDVTVDKLDQYVAEAKVIAQAIKEDGYEFASHSWGHRKYGQITLEQLQVDMQKYIDRVEPIVGRSEILIYPHGDDIAGASPYKLSNEKYSYFLSLGYRCFCNVDTTWLYWNQFNGTSLRNARIDIDGYTLYVEKTQGGTVIGKLGIDAAEVFDPIRPTPVEAQ